jgi:ankyrin repeat protein
LLLDHEADASKRNKNGLFAHDFAFNVNKTDMGKILGEAALQSAITDGDVDKIMKIVRAGIPPNVRTDTGWDALSTIASEVDDPDLVM